MTEENIRTLMYLFHVQKIKKNVAGDQIRASCPLAHRHEKGKDSNPSFSVKIDDRGKSVCYCFACGFSGTLLKLAREFGSVTAEEFVKEHEFFEERPELNSFGKFNWHTHWAVRDVRIEKTKEEPFNEDKVETIEWALIKNYLGKVPHYVLDRGINLETVKAFKLGYNERMQRVIIPSIDRRNRLVGYAMRSVGEPTGGFPKYLFNTGFQKSLFLFGEHLIVPERGDIVLVEGQFDVMKVYQAGFNVGGVLGSEFSDVQAMKVKEMLPPGKKVIIMADGDKAGEKLMNKIYEKLKADVPVAKRIMDNGKDPGDLTEKQIGNFILTNELR